MLCCMQVLLMRYSRCKDIVVGSPFAGRDVEETQRLIGFFVNVLPLHTSLEVGPSVPRRPARSHKMSCGYAPRAV